MSPSTRDLAVFYSQFYVSKWIPILCNVFGSLLLVLANAHTVLSESCKSAAVGPLRALANVTIGSIRLPLSISSP